MNVPHPPHHPLDTRLPALLRSGRRLRGLFNSLPSPAIVEMCGYAGFDFIILDNEHGSANLKTTEHMLRAARASGIVPVVRCLRNDISRVLDMGASGVQIPMVGSAEEARDLVQQVRYPRIGRRGSAFSPRAAGYGAFPGVAHTERSNAGVALIMMIETPGAVEQAAEIAAVPGVDAVFVGPNDLSHAMGFDNNWKAPEVEAALQRALCAIRDAGNCGGVIALTPDDEAKYGQWGARYSASTTTGLITQAFQQASSAGGRRPASAKLGYEPRAAVAEGWTHSLAAPTFRSWVDGACEAAQSRAQGATKLRPRAPSSAWRIRSPKTERARNTVRCTRPERDVVRKRVRECRSCGRERKPCLQGRGCETLAQVGPLRLRKQRR